VGIMEKHISSLFRVMVGYIPYFDHSTIFPDTQYLYIIKIIEYVIDCRFYASCTKEKDIHLCNYIQFKFDVEGSIRTFKSHCNRFHLQVSGWLSTYSTHC